MAARYDRAPLKATKTAEGFIADSPVLSRVGIFTYRRADGSTVREFRPPEEVFAAAHLDSLQGKPITDDHHGLVTSANAGSLPRIGAVLSKGRQDGDNLVADVTIHHTASIDAGKHELSLGYTLDLDPTPGEWQGQRYDAVQRNLRVNHLALVKSGRAGNARLNLDAADAVAATPEDETTMPLAKVRLDSGVEYEAPQEVVAALAAAAASANDQKARADKAEAARDGLQAKVDGHAAALAAAREDGRKDAAARVALEAAAKECGAEVRADMDDKSLRVAGIKAVRGDSFSAEGKTDAYLAAAFDLALEDAKKARADGKNMRGQAAGAGNGGKREDGNKSGSMSAAEAQRRYNAEQRGEKVE